MNPGWSPAHERAATLTFGQTSCLCATRRLAECHGAEAVRQGHGRITAPPFSLLDLPAPATQSAQTEANAASDPGEIYQRGAEKLDDILEWCAELHIPALTLWMFSTENLK